MSIRLIVGLGNPGAAYASTRHNAGYRVVGGLGRQERFSFQRGFHGRYARGRLEGQPLTLLLPETYMNRSGESVAAATRDLRPEEVLVVCDDLDLPVGRLRLRRGGSAGGHNGLKSVIGAIGPDFQRLRIGIGRPSGDGAVIDYVLAAPRGEEAQRTRQVEERAIEGLRLLLREPYERAQQWLHTHTADPEGGTP